MGAINWLATMCTGTLTIDGIQMHNPAFAVLDVGDLWLGPKQRGENIAIPGRPGEIATPKRATATTRMLRMAIAGDETPLGATYPNPMVGLETNVAFLRHYVSDPTYTGDGTRAATLTMPSGAVRHAAVHVLDLQVGARVGHVWTAVLEVSVPAGAFA